MLGEIHDHLIVALKNLPRVSLRWSIATSPSTGKCPQHPAGDKLGRFCSPFITTFIFPTRPWTTLRICATVCRASSCVNRSSLWTIASIFFSPTSFRTSLSLFTSQVINSLTDDHGLTKFSLLRLFRRQRKCGEQLHEYLDNHIVHGFCGWYLGIDLEAIEESM